MCAILLAATCLFMLAGTPAAAHAASSTGNITITAQQEDHSYTAYQLFSGTVDVNGAVADISWDGCMNTAFYTQLAQLAGQGSFATAQDAAEYLSAQVAADDDGAFAAQLSRIAVDTAASTASQTIQTGTTAQLASGWWLLVSDSAQPIIVAVGGQDMQVAEKSTPPGIQKQVANAPATDESAFASAVASGLGWQVVFEITGTLPSNYAAYQGFAYTFVDTLDDGLAADAESVAVQLVQADGATQDVTAAAQVKLDGQSLTVGFDDLKQAVPAAAYGDKLVLTYNAQLVPGKAAIGFDEGNLNSVYLRYTASPSYDATGNTVAATAKVYSFALRVLKQNADGVPLEGAEFALRNADGEYLAADGSWVADAESAAAASNNKGVLLFEGLDAGSYTLEEVKAPEGYEELGQDINLELSADIAQQQLDFSCSSDAAQATGLDAKAGVAEITVTNEKAGTSGGESDDDSGGSPIASLLPKTSDRIAFGCLLGLVAAALIALAVRKRRQGQTGAGA